MSEEVKEKEYFVAHKDLEVEAKIDGAFSIDDNESLPILYDLIQNEGLSLGTSCGVNIAGAIRLGKKLGPGKTIITVLCDKSERYSSKLFNRGYKCDFFHRFKKF